MLSSRSTDVVVTGDMKKHRTAHHGGLLLQLAVLFSVAAAAAAWPQDPFDMSQSCISSIDCKDPLDVLTSDKRELSTVNTKADMDRLCPNIKQHLECIDHKTKRCMNPEMRLTFNVLYNGTIVVMNELCHNETYQQEFLKYSRCFQNIKNEEDCETKYSESLAEHSTESKEAVQRICCSFQEYLDCSTRTVAAVCGDAAAQFNTRMLDTMATSLKEQCARVPATEACGAMSLASRSAGGGGAGHRPRALLLVALPALLLPLLLSH